MEGLVEGVWAGQREGGVKVLGGDEGYYLGGHGSENISKGMVRHRIDTGLE